MANSPTANSPTANSPMANSQLEFLYLQIIKWPVKLLEGATLAVVRATLA